MAYQASTQVQRELSAAEHLAQAAANLAGAGEGLSTAASEVHARRGELSRAEDELARAQESFDDRVREFRQILDQYGLTMSYPQAAPDSKAYAR